MGKRTGFMGPVGLGRSWERVEVYIGWTGGDMLQNYFERFCKEHAKKDSTVRITFEVEKPTAPAEPPGQTPVAGREGR